MANFIEVIGNAEYEEYPDKVMLDIDISVRASTEETAQKEIKEIVNKAIDHLLANGLSTEEVFFGGRETYTPWWRRNKAGVETRNRISIKSSNKAVVYGALEEIDRYQNDKRVRLEIEERQPTYIAKDDAVSGAMKQAMQDALNKAKCLAKASGCSVGKVLEIQEIKKGIRGSGSYGDYDFGDDIFPIAMAAGGSVNSDADIEPATRLERNARCITLRYRVKYQLV